ncbi:DNA repair protein rad52 [Nowakowskiella sp. JEL0078]|nr:DNA repair protein rad52 [Nowakowskiella sp. JEL0078]
MNGDEQIQRYNAGVSCIMRVTLTDGTYHEDVGFGSADNAKSKGAALEKAKKEASTDALKRTLRLFGNALGNCVHDKDYLREMSKMQRGPLASKKKQCDMTRLYRLGDGAELHKRRIVQKNEDLEEDKFLSNTQPLLNSSHHCIKAPKPIIKGESSKSTQTPSAQLIVQKLENCNTATRILPLPPQNERSQNILQNSPQNKQCSSSLEQSNLMIKSNPTRNMNLKTHSSIIFEESGQTTSRKTHPNPNDHKNIELKPQLRSVQGNGQCIGVQNNRKQNSAQNNGQHSQCDSIRNSNPLLDLKPSSEPILDKLIINKV